MEQTKSQASNIILGDNIRDYKKFLEIEKMSANSNNPLNISNGNNSNNNFNNTNNTNLSSFSSTNSSRVPFTYTPIRKADTSNNLPISQNTINVNRPLSNNTMSYYPINNNNNFQTNFGSDVYKEIQNMKKKLMKIKKKSSLKKLKKL